ncbi:hypothetical protein SIID45300_03053 [Candidatus Magnetaquicoccaceae bacterium FCR-1]|uniref:Virus attachment protein p12 family protein n=1 Tax=Candidatus Magnetaquiglobus chichijimensis TaxID=3141448 RepID=A0ABQ0CCR7_9PROT
MNPTLDAILLGAILLGCLVYIARRLRRMFASSGKRSGCQGCAKPTGCAARRPEEIVLMPVGRKPTSKDRIKGDVPEALPPDLRRGR